MSAFHFLRPAWLLALPPLLGLLWLLWRRRLHSRSWQEICDPALLPHLLLGRSRRRAPWPLWLLCTGLLLAVTALAGPTWQKQPQPLLRQKSALVILFDLSRSMTAGDLQPSRLVRARLKIEDILRQRREGQTALVAFAGDAFAVTPLTDDHRTIEALLPSLDPEIMPVQGSEPGRALELGAKLLQRAGVKEGTLLLVTDEDRPERCAAEARKLRQQGLQLAVLGVGTPDGAPIPLAAGGFFKDRQGNLVLPRLNEEGLRQLARDGGGSYRRLSIDDSDFRALLADLDSHRLDRADRQATRLGDRWQEAGIWLLWPLALLAATAFRRGWLTVLVLLLMLPPAPARALTWQELWQRPDQQAHGAFEAGRFDAAGSRFEDPRWKASALYRAGKYAEALKAQPKAQSADDWYNRGNALARSGQLAEALKAYDQALKKRPGDADAQANRRLVEQALQQQKQEQQKQKQQQGDKQGKGQGDQQPAADPKADRKNDQGKKQPGRQGPDSAADQKDAASGANPSKPGEQPSPPAGPSKAEESPARKQSAQEQAQKLPDQAQQPAGKDARAKAETAAGKPEQPTQKQAAGAALEEKLPPTAEERELQQWLQRIPDDPGGLLRRKFLYQYRQRGQQLETDRPW
jgi:Ca-activated chloride channel homolog